MKAKEYAERYRANRTDDTLAKIAFDFVMESKQLIDIRHAKSDSALFAILDECDNKWKTFANLVNTDGADVQVSITGFRNLVLHQFPFLQNTWKEYKENG